MMKEALEILSMVIVLNLEHGHFCTVQYSQYVVSRRVAFLVLIWRLGSVGVEIDRRATNKQLT